MNKLKKNYVLDILIKVRSQKIIIKMESGATVHYAICIMSPDKGSGVTGTVKFY